MLNKIAIIWLIAINLGAFFLCWFDKRKARRNQYRISEKTLFTVAVIGGSIGMLAGIYRFRHKTKHKSFTIGIPVIILLQIGLAAGVFHLRTIYNF